MSSSGDGLRGHIAISCQQFFNADLIRHGLLQSKSFLQVSIVPADRKPLRYCFDYDVELLVSDKILPYQQVDKLVEIGTERERPLTLFILGDQSSKPSQAFDGNLNINHFNCSAGWDNFLNLVERLMPENEKPRVRPASQPYQMTPNYCTLQSMRIAARNPFL